MGRLCLALALTAGVAAASGCATTKKSERAAQRDRLDARPGAPKSYSLFKKKELDKRHLRRGQRMMGSNALDSY
jgi:hypothetical protein